MNVTAEAKGAARTAQQNPVFRGFARGGYAASGVVHVLIGILVLSVAFGGQGQTDQGGAFKAIAGAPLGFAALWLLAAALWALGVWHLVEGALVRADGVAKTWGRRLSEWGQAAVFLALGAVAASVALGANPNGDQSAANASGGVLSLPGGPWLLGIVGVGIAIGGVAFAWIGVTRGFEKKLDMPAGRLGRAVRVLGVIGYAAKGLALAVVGVLLVVAAVRVDPQAAGGLDGAIAALIALPYGPWIGAAVGIGLAAYGVFSVFRARFAKL